MREPQNSEGKKRPRTSLRRPIFLVRDSAVHSLMRHLVSGNLTESAINNHPFARMTMRAVRLILSRNAATLSEPRAERSGAAAERRPGFISDRTSVEAHGFHQSAA